MREIPSDLVASIRAGDCVLWTGADLGALADRPGWAALLRELCASADAHADELGALIERGSLLTVFDWLRRHRGADALEAALAAKTDEDGALPESLIALGRLRWRAIPTCPRCDRHCSARRSWRLLLRSSTRGRR